MAITPRQRKKRMFFLLFVNSIHVKSDSKGRLFYLFILLTCNSHEIVLTEVKVGDQCHCFGKKFTLFLDCALKRHLPDRISSKSQ